MAALFERAPDACLLVGEDGVIACVNRAAEKMLGFERQHVVGRGLLSVGIVPQNEAARVVDLLSSLSDGADAACAEFALQRGDGGRVDVEIASSAVSVAGLESGSAGSPRHHGPQADGERPQRGSGASACHQ